MLNRRTLLATGALSTLPLLGEPVFAQTQSDRLTLGVVLEPSGLDPTASAASSIAEITLYNLYETLTRINADGSVTPLLGASWEQSSDLKTTTIKLRPDAKFHNGEPFNAASVKFSLDRAAADNSTNKDKRTFANLRTEVLDAHTVRLHSTEAEPDLLFLLGQATAIMVEPLSAPSNASKPIGTGPYQLEQWRKGASLTLQRWAGFRQAEAIRIARAQFKFISDPAAQTAALLAGDVDIFVRVQANRNLEQFKRSPKFQVIVSGSRAKTILAMNNAKKPLDDVRVRRAISAAIDRPSVIAGAVEGFGVPIGSHYVPGALGYVDTTAINPFNPEKAKLLLKAAGVHTPLTLNLTLPPAPYARQGGEVVAAQLAQVGITLKLHNVEWAQWLSAVYGNKQYELTLISHVEPFDLGNYAKPDYYWGYHSKPFNALYQKIKSTAAPAERAKLLAQAQRLLAEDAVNVYLFQPQWITVANHRLRGLWREMPIFVNDLAALSWA